MLRLVLSLPMALAVTFLAAQDLHVYYDAYTDSVYYQQGGKTVGRPSVRKGDNVLLHISNYNNYLYDVSIKTDAGQQPVAQGSALDFGSLLPGGAAFNPAQLIFGSTGKGLDLPNIKGRDVDEGSGAAEDKDYAQRLAEMRLLETNIKSAQTALTNLDKEMTGLNKQMQTAAEAQQVQAFAAAEIQRLRYNPQLAPHQIKRLTQEYMERIFGEADPKQLDLSAVLKKTDAAGELEGLKKTYEQNISSYSGQVETLKKSVIALKDPKFDFPDSNFPAFRMPPNNRSAPRQKTWRLTGATSP